MNRASSRVFSISGALIAALLLLGTMSGCSGVKLAAPGLTASQLDGTVTSEDLSSYFPAGKQGAFVLLDKRRNTYTIYNLQNAEGRVSPLSTFKIPNALFGLETGVLQDQNTLFKWDGKKNPIESWNSDHTLASAFSNSVVWYFQKVASGVGQEKIQEYLNKIDYGNGDISGGLTKFWLNSSLKISPLEQVVFLRKFYDYQLPFSRANVDTVKKIMVIYNSNGTVLSGKAGFAGRGIGWFVGYVEKGGSVYFFATEIIGSGINNGDARRTAEEILRSKGLL